MHQDDSSRARNGCQIGRDHLIACAEEYDAWSKAATVEEYLAAGVAGDHDVRILDMRLDPDLDSLLRDYQPDVVGITMCSIPSAFARSAAKRSVSSV
jgi:hypothetical protein